MIIDNPDFLPNTRMVGEEMAKGTFDFSRDDLQHAGEVMTMLVDLLEPLTIELRERHRDKTNGD